MVAPNAAPFRYSKHLSTTRVRIIVLDQILSQSITTLFIRELLYLGTSNKTNLIPSTKGRRIKENKHV